MKLRHKIIRAVVSIIPGLSQTSVPALDDGKTTPEEFKKLCREAATESLVLLKNDDMLPLNKDTRISIFGRCQINYFFCGYGSGGDVKAPYKTNLLQGFFEAGAKVNEELASWYQEKCAADVPYDGFWGAWPYHYDEFKLEDEFVKKQAAKSDAAIVVIGRSSGEDRDTKLVEGSWFLTKDEKRLLEQVTREFKKVLVVVNSGGFIDFKWLDNYNISALLFAWQGGQESGGSIADVVLGISYPSGKLADTIAREYDDQPSKDEFGLKKTHYVEDIFVGYRYFETFAKERVRFPFGYGKTYTKFDIDAKGRGKVEDDEVILNLNVKNIGEFRGKEVVQVYYGGPKGKLSRADKNLVRFYKTKELQPEENEEFEIRFNIKDLASFDDTGVTGHNMCWVVEPGDYPIYVGSDVRHAEKVMDVHVDELRVIEELEEAVGVKESFKRMANRKGALTFEDVPVSKVSVKDRIATQIPADIPQTGDKGFKLKDVKEGKCTMEQFIAQLNDVELENLSRGNQGAMFCTIGIPGNAGVFGGITADLRYYGIPTMNTNDGQSGNRFQHHTTLLPIGAALGCTWNPTLVKALCDEVGKEQQAGDSQVMLAPAINLHRNPLCGRNYEYFSEDPYLTALFAISYIRGIQDNGGSATIKHFACNNQEKHRWSGDSIVSQKALREIYLRAFEIAIKEAKPHWVMTSYNRINGILNAYSFDLIDTILRRQWGFKGLTMTDWWVWKEKCPDYKHIKDHGWRIRAGNNLFMPGSDRLKRLQPSIFQCLHKEDGLTLGELQRADMGILQFIIDHFPERMDNISIAMEDKYDKSPRNKMPE